MIALSFGFVIFFIGFVADYSNCQKFDSLYDFKEDVYNAESFEKFKQFEYTSKNGKKVYVFDEIIPFSLIMAMRNFFSVGNDWRYVLFDQFANDPSIRFDSGNGIPWKSWQNPTLFSDSRVGHILKNIVTSVAPNTTAENYLKQYQMTEVYSGIIRRGDVTQVHRSGNNTIGDAYSVAIYVNPIWRKNSYGEIIFYEDDDDFDIFGVVSPHFGRIIIWDSSIRYNMRPPSIAETSGQLVVFAQFHSNPTTIYQHRTYFDKFLYEMKDARKRKFVSTDNIEDVPKLDLKNHLTLQRQNKEGNKVMVFDDLFNKSDLDALRSYTIKYGKYFYDDSIDFTSDNVQWIAGFEVKKFVNSRFWPIVQQVATYVSGKDTWYPYDVACNLIRSADHTKFHLDVSEPNEEEMTFLLYLSPNWTADNYGETAFMELNHDSLENDYVAEVVPRYGRAVIFNGTFPHSARPPAPYYSGPRYTFAVKLSATKLLAVKKTLYEESRHDPIGMLETLREIQRDPKGFESTQKITAVHSFLASKQVQQAIRQKPKKEENFELMMDGVRIPGLESEVPLTPKNAENVKKMMKFYKNDLTNRNDGDDGIPEFQTDLADVIPPQVRVNTWKRFCKDKVKCLENFLDLFSEQVYEIRRRVIRDFYTFI